MKASELFASPRNWRTHPKAQQDALRGVLAEVGYADALLARELPDGGLELIDGHLRAETTPDQEVPVLVLDVDQDEANKLLTVLDPMAAMAEANGDALGRRRPDRRCASCEHWRCLHIPSSPNLGTCVFSYDHLQTNSQLRVLLRDGQYDCDTYRRKRT